MAFTGGYNIVDLTEYGRISVPGEFTPTAEQMEKIIDHLKPTLVVANFHMTAPDINIDITGFGVKSVMDGASTYLIQHILFSKNGNKLSLSVVN